MRLTQAILFTLVVSLSGAGQSQQAVSAGANQPESSNLSTTQDESPAQQRIAAAKQQLKADPAKVQAYDELAIAYIRRARETADSNYLREADGALDQGLKLDPSDFQLQRTQVSLMLSRHEFVQAQELALTLNRRLPDDVMTYGYLAEAELALGSYQDAETNAQWMMNLRPNNTPALMLGARLRALFGDNHGAIEFLNRAYGQTSPIEVEDQTWILNQIASIQIESGQTDDASRTLAGCEQLFPHYPYTMENLARVRMAQNRAGDAVKLLTEAAVLDGDPHTLFALAKAQEAAGQGAEARATFAEFEKLASDPVTATETAALDLILLKAESTDSAPDAMKLAEKQIGLRQDVWTLDAYAWALYANRKFQEADGVEQKAIAVGIKSAQLFDHAGHIAQKLNHMADANKFFRLSVQANASSEFAADAMRSESPEAGSNLSEQNLSQRVPAHDLSQAGGPQGLLRASDQPDTASKSAVDGQPEAIHPFAPVPEVLLMPQPTRTAHDIQSAQAAVARNPKDAAAFAGMGGAYFQRARETGDVSDYELAEQALNKSLDLVSADFSADTALGTMAEVCMGEHRFADALIYAQKALSLGTGDVSPFAIVGDAYSDMGQYDKAADAYGRLTPRDMTLSPRAAYARDSRLSYLKFIAGDTASAIKLMNTAVMEGVEAQLPSENMAWLHYELGEYQMQAGEFAAADAAYLAALNTHPGDYRALAALARLRANNGRYAEAIMLYQKAIAVVPMPIFIAELGDLYAKTGNHAEAEKQYALVEYIGLLGHINQVLHNRDLALFYADHDRKLTEALDLARKELEVRHDVYTWDALAWALYKNGKLAEAAKASEQATRFGTQDALLLFHAGMIAEGRGQHEQARSEFIKALQINPHFHLVYADQAQQQLTELQAKSELKEGPNSHAR